DPSGGRQNAGADGVADDAGQPKANAKKRKQEPGLKRPVGREGRTSACRGPPAANPIPSQVSRRFQRRTADAADDRRAIAASQWIAHLTSALGTIQIFGCLGLFSLSHGERSL